MNNYFTPYNSALDLTFRMPWTATSYFKRKEKLGGVYKYRYLLDLVVSQDLEDVATKKLRVAFQKEFELEIPTTDRPGVDGLVIIDGVGVGMQPDLQFPVDLGDLDTDGIYTIIDIKYQTMLRDETTKVWLDYYADGFRLRSTGFKLDSSVQGSWTSRDPAKLSLDGVSYPTTPDSLQSFLTYLTVFDRAWVL